MVASPSFLQDAAAHPLVAGRISPWLNGGKSATAARDFGSFLQKGKIRGLRSYQHVSFLMSPMLTANIEACP
jgi:hypothetical protein